GRGAVQAGALSILMLRLQIADCRFDSKIASEIGRSAVPVKSAICNLQSAMMLRSTRRLFFAILPAIATAVVALQAQQQRALSAADPQRRIALGRELQSIAIVDRKVMMPMPDGVRLATDIYRPKSATGKVPTVFVRTPYNFNFWDVHNGVPADMSTILA